MKTGAIEGNTARMFANCFGKFPLVSNHPNKAFTHVLSFSGIILFPFNFHNMLSIKFCLSRFCKFSNTFDFIPLTFFRHFTRFSILYMYLLLPNFQEFPTSFVPLILQNFQFFNFTFLASSFSFLICLAFLSKF